MKNARKFNERITIGGVPDSEDLDQLRELGYRTVIDLRDDDEKFSGLVEKRAGELRFNYINIPIDREAITLEDVIQFYKGVYAKESAPLYCFSRFGKRPLALLLLFEAVATNEPLIRIFQKSGRFGLNLEGDMTLRAFLVNFYNSGAVAPIVESIRKLRPDLLNA